MARLGCIRVLFVARRANHPPHPLPLSTLVAVSVPSFGAVGAVDVPDHISLWQLRLAICQPLQQYANVRLSHPGR